MTPLNQRNNQTSRPAGVGQRVFRHISAAGALAASLFLLASLAPSLAPRAPVTQGVASGVIAALGYEIGVGFLRVWILFELREFSGVARKLLRKICFAVALLITVFAFAKSTGWRNATREVFGLAALDETQLTLMAFVSMLVFIGVWLFCRTLWLCSRAMTNALMRIVPMRIAMLFGTTIAVLAVSLMIEGTALRLGLDLADSTFEAADRFVDPELPAPTDTLKTGSGASLVRWEELGKRGRDFIATAPTRAEIAVLHGDKAQEPIRVYVGLRAADTPEQRSEIALKEMIRVGAFDRSVLVVASPTGTGWMDPGAHDSLDFLLGGDVASVGVQFSYLASALALYVHPQKGIDQSRALFQEVYAYWSNLPQDKRPRLFVFGLSQGAFNLQSTLPLLDILGDPINGALWVGSPFLSPNWQIMRDRRRPDSHAWRPQYGNGSLARSMNQNGGLDEGLSDWGPIRLIFLQYASDPIVVFSLDSFFRKPDWLKNPRAPDVSPELRWVPVVTMLQTALDMMIALQVEGYGHFYIAEHYLSAWVGLLDPEGWAEEDSEALISILRQRHARR